MKKVLLGFVVIIMLVVSSGCETHEEQGVRLQTTIEIDHHIIRIDGCQYSVYKELDGAMSRWQAAGPFSS